MHIPNIDLTEKSTKWVRFGTFPNENVLLFPLAVLEIKLNKGAPNWVLELVKSGYLVWNIVMMILRFLFIQDSFLFIVYLEYCNLNFSYLFNIY
jgi:hypothetical protein